MARAGVRHSDTANLINGPVDVYRRTGTVEDGYKQVGRKRGFGSNGEGEGGEVDQLIVVF